MKCFSFHPGFKYHFSLPLNHQTPDVKNRNNNILTPDEMKSISSGLRQSDGLDVTALFLRVLDK
jgi:hypothetical protein